MEMEIKSDQREENLRNSVPFVKQLSSDSTKPKTDYSINGEAPYKPTTQKIFLFTQIISALAVSMGSLIVGFSSGYTSPALKSMNETLNTTDEELGWVTGLMPLAALVGGMLGGWLIENIGRRTTITTLAIPFFIGWMLIANAYHVYMVYAGRALCGVCVGIGSLAFPVYLGETVQPEVRGTLGLFPTAFGNIGILLSYFAGSYLNWSHLAFLGAALPVPFFLLMLITPETPRWFVMKERHEAALKSLKWLRGKNTNIDKEMRDLTRSQAESNREGGSAIGQVFSRKYLPALLIALGLMLFQQLSGINAVVFYAGTIFKKIGSTIHADTCSVILGVVNFASTFVAAAIIDKLGRKMLLYISSVAMILTLCILGVYLYLMDAGVQGLENFGWLPLASFVIYIIGFSIGFGPIPWLMLGEILPSKIRGPAASIATSLNWSCTSLVTITFPMITKVLPMYVPLWTFGVITIVGLIFVILFVPETRGTSLEEIEKKLTGGSRKVRAIKSNTRQLANGC